MSLEQIRRLTRTLGFRLSLWYGALFVTGALLLFSLIYYALRATVDRKDRELVNVRLQICVSIYETRGLESLREWLAVAHEARKQKAYFHRVSDSSGKALLLAVPEHWDEADVRLLDTIPAEQSDWTRIARDVFVDISVATARLTEGVTVQVARRTSSRNELLQSVRRIFAAVLAPTILLGLLTGMVATRRLTRPLRRLGEAVRTIIETRKLEVRVPTRGANDELQEFIVLFNRMIAQNENTLRLMKETLDNVAHDVGTPLTRLRGVAETALQRGGFSDECANVLEVCITETERIQRFIQTLLEVARAEGGILQARLEHVDMASVVEDAVALYEHVAEEKNVSLHFNPQRDCHAVVDPVRMRRVFANLLDNAVHYTPSGGSIHIEVECGTEEVTTRVRDTGVGISKEDLPRVWERLFRADTSRSHEGLGLGLSLVKAFVEANGGRVAAKSAPGSGSEFVVTIPRALRDERQPTAC